MIHRKKRSKKFQYSTGENLQGIEIKFDDKMNTTGNVYIETMEKSDPNNLKYIESGIFRNDQSWLYLIGNYSVIYIFSKKHLQLMHDSNKYRKVTTATSIGFLVPILDAEKYCAYKINTENKLL
jgi:hypothetical protein